MHAAAKTTENNSILQTVDSQNTLNITKLIHWPLTGGCYIWYTKEGQGTTCRDPCVVLNITGITLPSVWVAVLSPTATNHRRLWPIIIRAYNGPYCRHVLEGWLEFNVPFQHKYGYIRQAWCCLQVKLCDPCLSALCVPWCKKAPYKYSSFPFFISQMNVLQGAADTELHNFLVLHNYLQKKNTQARNDLQLFTKLVADGVLIFFLHSELPLDHFQLLMQHVLAMLLLHLLLHLITCTKSIVQSRNRSFRRCSSQPISWHSAEETKHGTTKPNNIRPK